MPQTETPFRVREEEIPRSGLWPAMRITILDADGRELGSYDRDYHGFGTTTFCPFYLHDRWWALYSPLYTATRIMTLPECEDWCGETAQGSDFCPAEYYVPRYRTARMREEGRKVDAFLGEGSPGWAAPDLLDYFDVGEPQYCPFALVSGCIWGDESSWRIEFIDLAGLPEREVRREARFGTLHLLDELSLREAVDMERWRPDRPIVGIVNKRWQNLATGESQ